MQMLEAMGDTGCCSPHQVAVWPGMLGFQNVMNGMEGQIGQDPKGNLPGPLLPRISGTDVV